MTGRSAQADIETHQEQVQTQTDTEVQSIASTQGWGFRQREKRSTIEIYRLQQNRLQSTLA